MSTLDKPSVQIPDYRTAKPPVQWIGGIYIEGEEVIFRVFEEGALSGREIRLRGFRGCRYKDNLAERLLKEAKGLSNADSVSVDSFLKGMHLLLQDAYEIPHEILTEICKCLSSRMGETWGIMADIIPVLDVAAKKAQGPEYIQTMIIEQGLYGKYERLVLEMSTGRKLVIKGKDLGVGESKSAAAREFEVLQGLCNANSAWDKIAYQLKWMRWIPYDCLIHIFNLHDRFKMGSASNAQRAKDSGYTGMLVHFSEPVASTVRVSPEAVKMLEETRKVELQAAFKTEQLKALEEQYKKGALGMPSSRFKELTKELTDRTEPKKEVITMAAETTKAESSVWTSMWNTTQKEMGDGVWRTTAEQTVRLLREPFMAAITKKMGSGAGLVVGSVLETEVGEGAFAMAIGGALGGMLYTLPAIDSKKAQRLAAELRTFGWHKSTSFLVELFMVHIRGKLVTIIAGLPEVEADWVAPEPGMFGVSAKVPSAKEKVAVEAP